MVSLGIGLTSNCNLHCAHCYRDQKRIYNLTLVDVQKVCNSLEISSIGFGTGENGLNPEYFQILDYLHSRHIKMTLASNGYTLSITPDEVLKYFKDVEFSVDFPDQSRQDANARRRCVRGSSAACLAGECPASLGPRWASQIACNPAQCQALFAHQATGRVAPPSAPARPSPYTSWVSRPTAKVWCPQSSRTFCHRPVSNQDK